VALKVVVAEPAGTVIVGAGTGSSALLLDSETAVPPAGAVVFRVTVHVALAPEVNVVGLHASEDRAGGAAKAMLTLCDTPFSVAKIMAVWLLAMLPAVALKVAVVEPAGTVTVDVRPGSRALLLNSEIAVPPAGAAWLRFTVQVALVPEVKLAALQDKEVSVGTEGPGPETVPPVAETANEEPEPDAATVFPNPIGVLVTPAAIIRFTIATVPFWIGVLFMPQAKQVYTPELAVQLSVLPALLAEDPALAEIDRTLLVGKVNVHWRAAGSLPAGDVKSRVRDTAPFAAAVPEERVRESVWPNAACVASKKKSPISGLVLFFGRELPWSCTMVLEVLNLTFHRHTAKHDNS
jgi:hypothetical protein